MQGQNLLDLRTGDVLAELREGLHHVFDRDLLGVVHVEQVEDAVD